MMLDEEKNEAVTGAPAETGAEGAAVTTEAPKNTEHEVVTHPLVFGFERKVKESLESRSTPSACRRRSAKC